MAKPSLSGVKKAVGNAVNKVKDSVKSSNWDKAYKEYNTRNSNSSNSSNSSNNSSSNRTSSNRNDIDYLTDKVSKVARDAASIKSEQRQKEFDNNLKLLNSQLREQKQAREEQSRAANEQTNQNRWSNYYAQEEAKRQQFNAQSRADAASTQQRNLQESMMSQQRRASSSGITQSGMGGGTASGQTFTARVSTPQQMADFQKSQEAATKAAEETRLKRRDEANQDADRAVNRTTDAQSRLQKEGADQRLASQREGTEGQSRLQREGTEGQSRLQREGADQRLASQREGTEGQSRLQRERTEQTSKLQSQAAAESAARTAGNRAAAIDAFRKFGKGKAA